MPSAQRDSRGRLPASQPTAPDGELPYFSISGLPIWRPSAATVLITDSHPEFAAHWVLAAAGADLASQHRTPATFQEAITGSDSANWKAAIAEELASLREHEVYRVLPRREMPAGSSPIRTKWVFKVKQAADGTVARYKARLTACGYAQKFGRDYKEIFAPVASAVTIRVVFLTAALRRLHLHQYDCRTAFLYGRLPADQRVYVNIPEGLDAPPGSVAALYRGLYGLKQSPRLFNEHLTAAMRHLGFVAAKSDPCLHIFNQGGGVRDLCSGCR